MILMKADDIDVYSAESMQDVLGQDGLLSKSTLLEEKESRATPLEAPLWLKTYPSCKSWTGLDTVTRTWAPEYPSRSS